MKYVDWKYSYDLVMPKNLDFEKCKLLHLGKIIMPHVATCRHFRSQNKFIHSFIHIRLNDFGPKIGRPYTLILVFNLYRNIMQVPLHVVYLRVLQAYLQVNTEKIIVVSYNGYPENMTDFTHVTIMNFAEIHLSRYAAPSKNAVSANIKHSRYFH